ncbi:hypothetical protein [Maricaulis sp.]|uniref:hypothetical protein n=1 Tax=Maricaulis sp. TaxID=1486257 RepID=UPI003A913499
MGNERIIEKIFECRDVAKLRAWRSNAQRLGAADVEAAAFAQLILVMPEAEPGTLDHALWRTVYAFEEVLREERGKTILLSRTRQKIKRAGAKQTLIDWALSDAETDGFAMLRTRSMLYLAGEAIVLRFADQFEPEIVAAARGRFELNGLSAEEIQTLADWEG